MANNDRIYAAYIGEMGDAFKKQTRDRIEWILEQTAGAKAVLDIGCSQGIVSILCAEQGARVTGIEVETENCEFANGLLHAEYNWLSDKINFINQDFMLYEDDQQYDVILLTEVLEHLPNAEAFLAHAKRKLSENGRLVITVPFSYCDHPDHVFTFYLNSLVELVEKSFAVEFVHYGGNWIGCTAVKNGEPYKLDGKSVAREEDAFLRLHKELDERIKDLSKSLADANQKYKESCESYEKVKEWYSNEQKKTESLTENYNRVKEWHSNSLEKINLMQLKIEKNTQVRQMLIDMIKAEHQQMLVMQKAKRTIQKQQTEIQLLRAENESNKQKLSKIYDTWYGRIALKCYNFLKKVKRMFKGH